MTPPASYRLTEDHLERGVPGKCDRCPVALCIREQGRLARVEVDAIRVWAWDAAGVRWHARLPGTASNAVCLFDRRASVLPRSFELRWELRPESLDGSSLVSAGVLR